MTEMDLLFGIEPFYVLTYLIGATAGGIAAVWKILKFMKRIDNRGQNQNKAIIVMADHMDIDSERLHPDNTPVKIKPTIETILSEEN